MSCEKAVPITAPFDGSRPPLASSWTWWRLLFQLASRTRLGRLVADDASSLIVVSLPGKAVLVGKLEGRISGFWLPGLHKLHPKIDRSTAPICAAHPTYREPPEVDKGRFASPWRKKKKKLIFRSYSSSSCVVQVSCIKQCFYFSQPFTTNIICHLRP